MADEQMSLDGILSDEKPAPREQPAPEPTAAPSAPEVKEVTDPVAKQQAERNVSKRTKWRDKEQAEQGRVRDPETGQYTKAEEATAKVEPPAVTAAPVTAAPAVTAAPQQEFTEKEKAFLRAAQEERGKRQALEQRLAAMEAAAPKEPEKTFWDDPEAALRAHEARIKAEATNARLGMAEFTARQKHPDFDEKIAVFAQLIQQTPGLHQQWLASPDPAEFAYKLGKNHQELQQVGSMDELRAKIERETAARVRAEVEAELKAKAEGLAQARADIPASLSQVRSTGGVTKPVWGGPTSLDNILKS